MQDLPDAITFHDGKRDIAEDELGRAAFGVLPVQHLAIPIGARDAEAAADEVIAGQARGGAAAARADGPLPQQLRRKERSIAGPARAGGADRV